MKKKLTTIKLFLVAALWLPLLASCSDSDIDNNQSLQNNVQPLDANQDITYGCNLFISGADTLSSQRILLNTDIPVTVTSRDGKVTFNCIKENGRYYLEPVMLGTQSTASVVDKVTISVLDNSRCKDMYVSVRKTMTAASRANEVSIDEQTKQRFAKIFSEGIFPVYEPGDVTSKYAALDWEILNATDSNRFCPVHVSATFQARTTSDEYSGNTQEEMNKKWGISLGLQNIPIPLPGAMKGRFGGSLGYEKTNKSTHYFEYASRTRRSECAYATVNYNQMAESIAKYISWDLNKILNANGATGRYALKNEKGEFNEEGVFNILDDYGTHIPTEAIIGASATYTMTKKSDLEMSGTEWKAQVNAIIDRDSTSPSKISSTMSKDQLECVKYINDQAPKGEFSFNYSTTNTLGDCDIQTNFILVGGNSNTSKQYTDFSATDDPNNWTVLRYSDRNKTYNLQPLYNFVINKESEMYKALKQYIDGDTTSVKKYYKHRDFSDDTNTTETKWVLAGIKFKIVSNGTLPQPFRDKCPDGVERTFYPMMMNNKPKKDGDYTDNMGKGLDTEIGEFGKLARRKMHTWYYALALHEDCPGISDIKFFKTNESHEDYQDCTEGGNTGTGWVGAADNEAQLYVKPISKTDTKTTPITAFAFYDDLGDVISSTGGTEYTTDAQNRINFNAFWANTDKDNESYITRRNENPSKKYGVYDLYARQPRKLYYMYSTRPLNMGWGKDKHMIQHPSDMRKGN